MQLSLFSGSIIDLFKYMKKSELKFLQVGLGSMGTRRIRNLLANGIQEGQIFGFDISDKKCLETSRKYRIRTKNNFYKAVKECNPDVFIISTPPDKHDKYFLYAAKNKKHFFVEPSTTDKGYKKLLKLLDNNFVAASSCTLRYIPAITKIRKLVQQKKIGKILAFQYHSGQYLPDWHSWEDFRDVYFSKKKTGACREMFPFELKWLNEIIGSEVRKITGFTSKVSDLKISADDIYLASIEYKNKVLGSIIIDLLSRDSKISLRLIGSKGIIDWDWKQGNIKLFNTGDKKWKTIKIVQKQKKEKKYDTPATAHYLEIKDFLGAVLGKKKFPGSFNEDYKLLNTLFALEKSSKFGRTIYL